MNLTHVPMATACGDTSDSVHTARGQGHETTSRLVLRFIWPYTVSQSYMFKMAGEGRAGRTRGVTEIDPTSPRNTLPLCLLPRAPYDPLICSLDPLASAYTFLLFVPTILFTTVPINSITCHTNDLDTPMQPWLYTRLNRCRPRARNID